MVLRYSEKMHKPKACELTQDYEHLRISMSRVLFFLVGLSLQIATLVIVILTLPSHLVLQLALGTGIRFTDLIRNEYGGNSIIINSFVQQSCPIISHIRHQFIKTHF